MTLQHVPETHTFFGTCSALQIAIRFRGIGRDRVTTVKNASKASSEIQRFSAVVRRPRHYAFSRKALEHPPCTGGCSCLQSDPRWLRSVRRGGAELFGSSACPGAAAFISADVRRDQPAASVNRCAVMCRFIIVVVPSLFYFENTRPGSLGSAFFKRNQKRLLRSSVRRPSIIWPSSREKIRLSP